MATVSRKNSAPLSAWLVLALAGGVLGCNGKDGANGKDGTNYLPGNDGAKGDPGAQGERGPKGDQGDPGAMGLVGAEGDAGPAGPVGPVGPQGPAGASAIVDPMQLTADYEVYPLAATGASGVSGHLRFAKLAGGSTLASVKLDVSPSDLGLHPVKLRANAAAKGGAVVLTLNPVDAFTGVSETLVSRLDDGSPVSYADLIAIDAHLQADLGASDSTAIAVGDVGGNALTGNEANYVLATQHASGVSGSLRFSERVNGFTLVTLTTTGALSADAPVLLQAGTLTSSGAVLASLGSVPQAGGSASFDLRARDDQSALAFGDLVLLDANLVLQTSSSDATTIAGGDIGHNAFDDGATTPVSVNLAAVGSSGVSGVATIHKLVGSTAAVVEVTLNGTVPGSTHPVGVFDASSTPVLALSLTSVRGGSGTSGTSGSAPVKLRSGASVTFASLSAFVGTIRVSASPSDSSVVAQGTIN